MYNEELNITTYLFSDNNLYHVTYIRCTGEPSSALFYSTASQAEVHLQLNLEQSNAPSPLFLFGDIYICQASGETVVEMCIFASQYHIQFVLFCVGSPCVSPDSSSSVSDSGCLFLNKLTKKCFGCE